MLNNIIRIFKTRSLWHIVWLSVAASESFTAIMSIILRGRITYDYLITGGLVSLIVSSIAVYLIKLMRETEEELKESKEMLEDIAQGITESILLLSKDFKIRWANKAVLRQTGLSMEELLGSYCYKTTHHREQPCQPPGDPCPVSELLKTGEPQVDEHTHYDINGNKIFVEVSAYPIKNDSGEIVSFVHISKDITTRKKMEENLRALSLTDELTGLHNRRGFFTLAEKLLKIAKRQKKGLFLLYADLDGLKEINDTWGHQDGDVALVDIASILKTTYRESDIIARIGGDEFVIMPVGTIGDDIRTISARLQKNVEAHNAKRESGHKLSLSLGIYYYDPENPCSIDELLSHADKLMYDQKKIKLQA